MRVADFVANYIYEELGVHHVFALTGAGIMHLTDGLASHPKLKTICVHHEQTASMALEAYSRATENFGVGYFTTGPGSTNAITGLGGAWQDSVPCLFISGQVKRVEAAYNSGISKLRQFGVQELNIIPVVESLCKYAIMLNEPSKVRYELEKAIHVAKSGRPGPVWIDIPMDVQATIIDPSNLEKFVPSKDDKPVLDSKQIKTLVDFLKQAKRPVIIAGRGVRLAGAIDSLSKLVSEFGIPVVTPFLGVDNMRHDDPRYVGKTGVKGDRPANFAMQNSDLVIAIGTSLHVSVIGYDYTQFAREAKKVVIDIDETSHRKKTINIDLFIKSDAKDALDALINSSKESGLNNYSDWLKQCNVWKEKYKVCLSEYKNTKDAINSYVFIDQLSKQASEGDIFVSDAGGTFYAVSQAVQLTKPRQRYITSGAMATMGFTLPAAIGISVATGGKRVLAITGDGSLQLNIQELQTVIEYKLPIKLFVLNNDGYQSIRVSQNNYFNKRFIGESSQSGISFPDTLKIADAYGIKAVRVSDYKQLPKVIDDVLSYDGPIICEVIVPRDQQIVPTVSSRVNEDGSMSSRPLEDMFPFLDRDEYRSNLYVKEV
jgi:acetolactate synthase-1/2/3 large subunit